MGRPKKDKPLSGKERNVKFDWSLNKGGGSTLKFFIVFSIRMGF